MRIIGFVALALAGIHPLLATAPASAESAARGEPAGQLAEATRYVARPPRAQKQGTGISLAIQSRQREIYDDPSAPVIGNPEGDVIVVMFFDYRCPYCKKVAPVMEQLAESDPSIRIVYKELPILGHVSRIAARAALAADRQGKYIEFHRAMMQTRGRIGEGTVMSVASRVGLDMARLKRDMADPRIDAALARNRDLATALRISGTPAYVINSRVERGTGDLDDFRELLAADLAMP